MCFAVSAVFDVRSRGVGDSFAVCGMRVSVQDREALRRQSLILALSKENKRLVALTGSARSRLREEEGAIVAASNKFADLTF
jgi:hypothetical protein